MKKRNLILPLLFTPTPNDRPVKQHFLLPPNPDNVAANKTKRILPFLQELNQGL